MGDRLNEWRQRRVRLSPLEIEIESLSDAEVHGVLACLERNGALGRLEDLEPAARVTAVKEKHEKQLLVVMKEVTENAAFPPATIAVAAGGLAMTGRAVVVTRALSLCASPAGPLTLTQ